MTTGSRLSISELEFVRILTRTVVLCILDPYLRQPQGATVMSPSDGVIGGSGGATSDGHKAPKCSSGLLQIRIDTRDGYARVAVAGEIDYDSATLFKAALTRALGRRGDILEVDLAGVLFCDCAGLNVLLHVRKCAEGTGVTLTLARVGSPVLRLLTLTETSALFRIIDPMSVPPVGPARCAGLG